MKFYELIKQKTCLTCAGFSKASVSFLCPYNLNIWCFYFSHITAITLHHLGPHTVAPKKKMLIWGNAKYCHSFMHCFYIHYKQDHTLNSDENLIIKLNKVGFVLGTQLLRTFSCGTFPENNPFCSSWSGAVLTCGIGSEYCWLSSG
jgi:hypothetical protein